MEFMLLLISIPAILISLFVKYIVPPIITFVIMAYIAIKNKKYFALICNIIFHFLLIRVYYVVKMVDTYNNLNYYMLANFIVIGSLVFLLLYWLDITRKKKPKIQDIKCTNCGAYNKENYKYCAKCGKKLDE